jgi:chemotaxis protein histidine kinase CheA
MAKGAKKSKPRVRSVVEGAPAKPAGDRTEAALNPAPPADELAARRQAVAAKQAELEAQNDAGLESDNPAETKEAKPVVVAKPDKKSKKAGKTKLTDKEKAAKAAAREFEAKEKKEKKRKKEVKQTTAREGQALAGELEPTPSAPKQAPQTTTRSQAVEKTETPPQSTGQLNLIPRLVGLVGRGVSSAAKNAYRLRNDAAIAGGGAGAYYGFGKAGGLGGAANFIMNGFGGSEEKKDTPSPSRDVTPSGDEPAAPMSFREKLMQQQQRSRAKMPPDRSGKLLEAIKNRSIG